MNKESIKKYLADVDDGVREVGGDTDVMSFSMDDIIDMYMAGILEDGDEVEYPRDDTDEDDAGSDEDDEEDDAGLGEVGEGVETEDANLVKPSVFLGTPVDLMKHDIKYHNGYYDATRGDCKYREKRGMLLNGKPESEHASILNTLDPESVEGEDIDNVDMVPQDAHPEKRLTKENLRHEIERYKQRKYKQEGASGNGEDLARADAELKALRELRGTLFPKELSKKSRASADRERRASKPKELLQLEREKRKHYGFLRYQIENHPEDTEKIEEAERAYQKSAEELKNFRRACGMPVLGEFPDYRLAILSDEVKTIINKIRNRKLRLQEYPADINQRIGEGSNAEYMDISNEIQDLQIALEEQKRKDIEELNRKARSGQKIFVRAYIKKEPVAQQWDPDKERWFVYEDPEEIWTSRGAKKLLAEVYANAAKSKQKIMTRPGAKEHLKETFSAWQDKDRIKKLGLAEQEGLFHLNQWRQETGAHRYNAKAFKKYLAQNGIHVDGDTQEGDGVSSQKDDGLTNPMSRFLASIGQATVPKMENERREENPNVAFGSSIAQEMKRRHATGI